MSAAASFTRLADVLAGGARTGEPFRDPVHARLVSALLEPAGSPLDVAVLMRHALLAEAARRGEGADPALPLPAKVDEAAAARADLRRGGDGRWRARPWRPEWLQASPPDAIAPDALGARASRRRFAEDGASVAADPFLARLGRDRYRSVGQRAGTRAALLTPPGATTTVDLPTGEGKSLIFQAVDRVGFASDPFEAQGGPGITLVIVPTVALAYDHERGCRRDEGETLAYVGSGSPERRESIRRRLAGEQDGLIFAAPEAACGSLRRGLLAAARGGRLKAIVIDEAHLVDAWGTGFRTDFQSLSGLRRELIEAAPEGEAPRTLLLSATLTPETMATLRNLFSGPGDFRTCAASQVRPEPAYWVAPTSDEAIQDERIDEALLHLPRPLVLYVTEVRRAIEYGARLASLGFGRIATFHGRTPDVARRETLGKWSEGGLDVVVATSAFGLGVDYQHVRAVVHACVPETFDRFYQEVGRGGRDGRECVSVVVPSFHDVAVAESLNEERVIGVDRGLERWTAMFNHADCLHLGGMKFRLRLDVAPGQGVEDIDMIGERSLQWNARLVALLARAGMLRFAGGDRSGPDGAAGEYEIVEMLVPGHLEAAAWRRLVEPARGVIAEARRRSLGLMTARLRDDACPCRSVADLYGRDHVDMACSSCRLCRNDPALAAPTASRREPRCPWSAPPLAKAVADILGTEGLLVTYPSEEAGLSARRRASAALEGLLRAGVRCVSVSGEVPRLFERAFADLAERPVFVATKGDLVAHRLPKGPRLLLVGPSAAFRIPPTGGGVPLVVLLPDGHRDPDRPGEAVLDRWRGSHLSLDALVAKVVP